MRTVVGDRTVTEVLTIGRIEIAAEVKKTSPRVTRSVQTPVCSL